MKRKLAALLLVVVFVFSCTYAGADIDLAAMSFDELVALQSQIIDEMQRRDEWTYVVIPGGVYEIGVDIPEGTWTISAEPHSDPYVNIGNGINETRTDFADGCIEWAHLVGEYNSHYDESDMTSVTWNFSKGHYFISDSTTIWTKPIRPAFDFSGQGE